MKNFIILIFVTSVIRLHSQFLPTVTWTYAINSACFGSPAAADLDNDGKKEIVFSTYAEDGKVHCLNSENGSVKWTYNIGGCGDVALNIYDLDMDGQLDVFVHGSCNPAAFCLNGNTGSLTWSVSSGGGDSPATIADIDNDGKPELVFGNFAGQIKVLNGENGSTAKSIPVYTTALQTEPILTDVNNDGVLDIIVANYHNTTNTYSIHCIDYTSTNPIWTNTMTETSIFHAYHGGAIADIDKDGKMEYVIGAKNGLIRALNVEDGSVLWSVSNPGSGCMGAVTIADINSDDTLDVIYHREGTNSGIEILNGFNGNIMWAHTISIGGSFRGSSISDLNGNGKLDLISTHYMGSAHAIEPFTGTLWTVNTQSFFPTYPSLVPYITADNAPIISDFDGDGSLDVFFAMGYGSYTISPNSVGMAFMLKGGVGTCPEWLMFRKDNRRTGYLSTAEVNAQCNTTDISNNSMYNEDIYLYPQPCLDKVEIHSNSPDFIVKQITVHDIQGKEIQLVSDLTNSITNHFTLNTQKLNPGLYFVTLKDGIKTKQLKLIKVN